MHTIFETVRLIRIINCLMAMLGVGIGAYMIQDSPVYYGPVMSGLSAFLVCGAGNIVNDLVDIEIDRTNRPDRVLVRQALSRRYAITTAFVFNLLAIGMAVTVNWPVTAIGLAAIGLLCLYNFILKRVPLVGNVVIALLGGMTFLTGGLAVDYERTFQLPGPLIPALFAFLFHIIREIIKDAEDIKGDRSGGVTTLPQVIGVRRSLAMALFLFGALAAFTLVPVFWGWFGRWYYVITVYTIDLPLMVLLALIWLKPSQRMLRAGSVSLKAGMALGVVALLGA